MEWLIFRGANLIYGGKEIYRFCFNLLYFVFEGNLQVQAPGGLIFGGAIKRRAVFALRVLGGLYLEGLVHGGAFFWTLTVFSLVISLYCNNDKVK